MLTANDLNNNELIKIRMENNMREKLAYIPARHPKMDVIEIGSTLVVNSALPSDTFNTAFGGQIDGSTAKRVFDYYREKNFPMAWWVGPSSQTEYTDETLQAAGFNHDEYDVGMVANLLSLPEYSYPGQLEIKQCETDADFNDFGEVLSSIFAPYPEEAQVKRYYQQLHLVPAQDRPDLKLFVGYINGKAVSTAGLFLTDCAGIFDISTRPEERQKGYGTALFYRALEEAKSLGQQVSVLQASPDGLNIYKRFGFQQIGDFNVWSNAEALDA
ncbi:GNAT family N-acetyltransferase [Legionella israelensis]|uniref:GNAT family N-acetyltransferase n=1 Tax=Legionella israelensis TaxID=454 RepID=A0A0W0WS88_9GAMM|nr:GNAT family N-acetyltransferase [Legionella israelensis]KTD35191.1 GNAT family acetyltransferase [Legionella israelensis]QBR84759.1 GNAT family N-acetyltransferase [Legionella israelensis]QBS10407.1 GNAT family N-acetyltransferase [Legionella israelensis]QDP73286.1 GNAT family N-acetyltransferase [Legionella israelensis]SCY42453.1 Acetyltransferase (GNAT) domain-containing protein [Legionella israelensis DSM 19235]